MSVRADADDESAGAVITKRQLSMNLNALAVLCAIKPDQELRSVDESGQRMAKGY